MPEVQSKTSRSGQSTRQSLRVLRHLSAATDPVGVAEIARALGLHPSVVHRACATLEAAGFARRPRYGSKYRVGPQGSFLVAAFLQRYPIRQITVPYLREIVIATEGEIELFVRIGWYSVRLLAIEPPRQDISPRRLGESHLLHETDEGLLFLAHLTDTDLKNYCAFATRQGSECNQKSVVESLPELNVLDAPLAVIVQNSVTGGNILLPLRNGGSRVLAIAKVHLPDNNVPEQLKAIASAAERLESTLTDLLDSADEDSLDQIPNDEIILPNL